MDADSAERFQKHVSDYDYIRFSLCDIQGRSICKLFPARNAAAFLEEGVEIVDILTALGPLCDVPNNLVTAPEDYYYSNGRFVPIPDTLHPLPWAGAGRHRIGSVQCEMRWLNSSEMQACPRTAARKQVERLRKEFGLTVLSGVETEISFYKPGTKDPVQDGYNFCNTTVSAKYEPFFCDLDSALHKAGINMTMAHVELDPGQVELTFQPRFGIQTAEQSHLMRNAVKEISSEFGWDYSFMSRPKEGITNGAHLNFSLWDVKGEKNAFWDPDKQDNLSDVFRHFLGGMLAHSGAMTAFCCPTVNCYRRLHEPFAPDVADWGIESRLATMRVKNHSAKAARIENRLPSGLANPYLALAATLAAGMDGLRQKTEPPPMYQKGAAALPATLDEALKALQADKAMEEGLGPELVRWFVEIKRQFEVEKTPGYDPKVFSKEDQRREWEMYSAL